MNPTKPVSMRILLGVDLNGVPRVLATDSAEIDTDVGNVSTDAEEIGLVDGDECQRGCLYLWEGTSHLEYESWEAFTPTEVVYTGTVRPVQSSEVAALLAMCPPEPEVPHAL